MFPASMRGMHDLYEPLDPPYRKEIPIYKPSDRCGSDHIKVDPAKIAAVVKTNRPNEIPAFTPVDAITAKIGENVALFLEKELREGRIPASFLPIQSGVGNVANAVLGELGKNPHIPPFEMYSEVVQDSVVDLIKAGHCKFASGCSLRLVESKMAEVLADLDFFRDKLLLRPQETSNNPEIIRRLGLIAINTALEADIYGNVNSTHVCGTKMMNGIGGSGDFARNAYISIFTTASTAKNGAISSIVPMVTHLDHSEHSRVSAQRRSSTTVWHRSTARCFVTTSRSHVTVKPNMNFPALSRCMRNSSRAATCAIQNGKITSDKPIRKELNSKKRHKIRKNHIILLVI